MFENPDTKQIETEIDQEEISSVFKEKKLDSLSSAFDFLRDEEFYSNMIKSKDGVTLKESDIEQFKQIRSQLLKDVLFYQERRSTRRMESAETEKQRENILRARLNLCDMIAIANSLDGNISDDVKKRTIKSFKDKLHTIDYLKTAAPDLSEVIDKQFGEKNLAEMKLLLEKITTGTTSRKESNDDDKWEMSEGAQGVPLGPVEQINQEKSFEQLRENLEAARKRFALAEVDHLLEKKRAKKEYKEDNAFTGVDITEYQEAKEEYIKIINAIRAERMTQAKEEISGMNLSPEQEEQELKKRAQDILKETLVSEAIELNDLEQNLRTEQRGAFGRGFEKAWKNVLGVSEKYQKMSLKKKLLIAGGLMAAGATAGLAGGIFAGAVGGGVIAARWTQRALSGVGIFRGLESAVKHSQEKKTEKKAQKEFGDNLIEVLEQGDEYLDQKIFKLNKQKDKERVRRYLLAAGGAIVGSMAISKICGAAAGEVKEYFGWGGSGVPSGAVKVETPGAGVSPETITPPDTEGIPEISPQTEAPPADVRPDAAPEPETPPVETTPSAPDTLTPTPEASSFSSVYEVKTGGNVWKGLEEKLTEKYGHTFTDLKPGQKDYIIDKFKDYVGAHKGDFGLTDMDRISAGQKIDFSAIFENNELTEKAFDEVSKLSSGQIQDIEKYTHILNETKGSALPETGSSSVDIPSADTGSAQEFAKTSRPSLADVIGPPEGYADAAEPSARPESSNPENGADQTDFEKAQAAYEETLKEVPEANYRMADINTLWNEMIGGGIEFNSKELSAIGNYDAQTFLNGERPTRPSGFWRSGTWDRGMKRLGDLLDIHRGVVEEAARRGETMSIRDFLSRIRR